MDESHAATAIPFLCSVRSNTHVFLLRAGLFSLHVPRRLPFRVVELICAQEFVEDVKDSSLLM